MKRDKQPRVGVSCGPLTASIIATCSHLKAKGIIPVLLENDPAKINEQLDGLDGIIVMGNTMDVLPELYGAERDERTLIPHEDSAEYKPYMKRLEYETALIKAVMASEKPLPLLGICRGMQMINVTADDNRRDLKPGTLCQHLDDAMPGVSHLNEFGDSAPFVPDHLIKIVPGSRLEEISEQKINWVNKAESRLPKGIYAVNSVHHQGVEEIHQGFVASAYGPTGNIEALEPDPNGPYADRNILCVQFHPEFTAGDLDRKILTTFAGWARQHALERPHNEDIQRASAFSPALQENIELGKPTIEGLFENVRLGVIHRQPTRQLALTH